MTGNINSYSLKGTDGKHYILRSHLDHIYGAIQFMRKVIYDQELFSTLYTTATGIRKTTISSLGKHLKCLPNYSYLFSKDYCFSPLLVFFFDQYRKHPISDYLPPLHGHDRLGVDLFNDFVTTMRKNAIAINLKTRVADWESKSKKGIKRLKKFEADMFNRHARVVAIRLDFNYHKATFTPAEIDRIFLEAAIQKERDQAGYVAGDDILTARAIEGCVALEEVQNDRKHLFNNMKGKPSLFKHLIGYVWCIECAKEAGYHMHVFLFFDGSEVKKHEFLAQKIGCYMRDVITQGRSYFENCNRKKAEYGDLWALEIGRAHV